MKNNGGVTERLAKEIFPELNLTEEASLEEFPSLLDAYVSSLKTEGLI